jgi:hypothetical protein
METRILLLACLTVTALAFASDVAAAAPSDAASLKTMSVTTFSPKDLQRARSGAAAAPMRSAMVSVTSSAAASPVAAAPAALAAGNLPPLWTFDVRARRDGKHHQGAMVGTNPFEEGGTSRVATQIIPLILRTHTIATGLDLKTGFFSTSPGNVTIDPTEVDNTWLTAPNNVPSRLLAQSPLFQPAPFTFGSTYLGTTQYVDALQRGSFYKALGENIDNYHVLLDPVSVLKGIVVDVPANEGLAITDPLFFGAPACCAPFQFVDINWLDTYINGTLLPQLAKQGVGPSTLPIFLIYNAVIAFGVTDFFGGCCIGGYHSIAGEPTPTQAYAVSILDESGFFGPGGEDTTILSHELGEWANDPYVVNLVPPWGHTGQVSGCQGNLEVGDPLTGTIMPPVVMPNGHAYQLQELVFFSWFFGGSSLGVNGWYSSNGTFTTDAGPVCP